MREQLQALVNKGIVRKSCSSYASPIVPVRKKDGSLRFCVDYRQLNEKTVRDAFPLPRIEESLESLGGARLFSSLDLSHGYFQVKVHPNSVHLTAFCVPWSLYEFVRLPQGLMNSPSTFQRIMEYTFGDLNMHQLLLYLDDILVLSSDYEEHISRLDEVLKHLIDAGLKLKGKKCHLFCHQVEYLGHVVSGEGLSADPGKVERIKEWPVPQNSEELSSFLGLASYPRFAEISAPLNALRVNKHGRAPTREFSWNSEADQEFAKLKNALSSPPVLAYPVYGQDFVVEVDASFKGLGACLGQKDKNGHLHPIAYASRGLRGSEKRYPDYSSFKLELLGLKWAIADKFGGHLLGHHTIVLTDNNPLAHLASAKLGATKQRWIAKLAPTPKARPLMQHLLAFRPLELLAIDFLKVDRDRHGMEDILVCTDAFTKWAQATPCSNQLAVTDAKKLRDCWFTVYGIPSRLHSDQGRNFESQLIHELCQLYGIRKSRTTPYHAQGNPQTERFSKTLCGLIKSLDQAHRNRWPDLLSHLVFIYNTTQHCVTGVPPYTLMFGREPCIPIDYLVDNLHSNWDEGFVSLQADMMGKGLGGSAPED